jgi:hypothetical protein
MVNKKESWIYDWLVIVSVDIILYCIYEYSMELL